MNILRPGQVIHDKVRVDDFLGGGGQSFTFLGEYTDPSIPHWKKRVFIKQYNDLLADMNEYHQVAEHYQRMHERLADKAHYLCLPDFVAPFEGSIVALYPFLEGKSLEDWMSEGLTEELSLRFAFGVTTAVQALHKAGIAHLDLKPDNVLIKQNKRSGKFFVHIIDVDAAMIDGKGLRPTVYGSPGYMSPEHVSEFRRQFLGQPSDIYALGIILCELLFKRYPFSEFAEGEDVVNQRPNISELSLYQELVPVIRKCFERDTRRRPTAGSILWHLNQIRVNQGELKESPNGVNAERPLGDPFAKTNTEEVGSKKETKPAKQKTQTRVQIVQRGFDHSYYKSVMLTRRNFVGSTISSEEKSGEVISLELKINGSAVRLTNMCEGLSFSIGPASHLKKILRKGESAEVRSGDWFEFGGTGVFSKFKRKHQFQIRLSE